MSPIGQARAQRLGRNSRKRYKRISQSRDPSSQSVVLGLITQVPHRGEVGLGTEGSLGMEGIPDQEDTEKDGGHLKNSVFDLG